MNNIIISVTITITISVMISIITLPTPILVMSFAVSRTFNASLRSPVFASLPSAIVRKNKKIMNKTNATIISVTKEPDNLAIDCDIASNA